MLRDYGFADSEHFAPAQVDDELKEAAVCKRHSSLKSSQMLILYLGI